jgi:hypothetical protein
MRMKFYIQGSDKKGEVNLEVVKVTILVYTEVIKVNYFSLYRIYLNRK